MQLIGQGGERARTIVSYYARLALPELHALVVDTLLYVFGEDGASAKDIAGVLGSLDVKTVQRCVDRIPREVLVLTGKDDDDDDEDAAAAPAGDDAPKVTAVAMIVVNYATALPFIYAHWRWSLAVTFATLLRTDEVQGRRRVSRLLSEAVMGRPHELHRVVTCAACSLAFDVREVAGLAQCPECSTDLVSAELASVQSILRNRDEVLQQQLRDTHSNSVGPSAVASSVIVPLAVRSASVFLRDPSVLQQALAMEALFASSFVLVDGSGVVPDYQNVLLVAEFQHRSQGKTAASLLFRFRRTMRVRLVSSEGSEAMKVAENERRIAARALYPPWFTVAPGQGGTAAGEGAKAMMAAPPTKKARREKSPARNGDPMARAARHIADVHFAEFIDVPLRRPRN